MNAFFKGISLTAALAVLGFAAQARAAISCAVDTDCTGGGSSCGGDVCAWVSSTDHHCVAAGTDPGWCTTSADCKCQSDGATCDATSHNCSFTTPQDGGTAGAGGGGSSSGGAAGTGGMAGSAGSATTGGSAGVSTGGSAGASTGGSAGGPVTKEVGGSGGGSSSSPSKNSAGCGCRIAADSGSSSNEALALALLGAALLWRRRRKD